MDLRTGALVDPDPGPRKLPAVICDIDGTIASNEWRVWMISDKPHYGDHVRTESGQPICVACREPWVCRYATRADGSPGYQDWDGFHAESVRDAPVPAVVRLLRLMTEAGKHVIFITGRDETNRENTTAWLEHFDVPLSRLVMRPTGNRDPSTVLKTMLYKTQVEPHFRAVLAIDDNEKDCWGYRKLGIAALQVIDPVLKPLPDRRVLAQV